MPLEKQIVPRIQAKVSKVKGKGHRLKEERTVTHIQTDRNRDRELEGEVLCCDDRQISILCNSLNIS